MKEKLTEYRWLIHGILAVVILVLALILPFFNPEKLIVTLFGLILIGFAVFRIYKLIRHPKWDNLLIKRINLIEMIAHLIIGIFLLVWIWALDESLELLLGYLIGVVLIARGVVYFYSDQNKTTNDDFIIFALHIGAIIGGSYIIFQGDFTAEVLLGFIVVMAMRRGYKYGFMAFNEFQEKQKSLQAKTLATSDEPQKTQSTIENSSEAKDIPDEKLEQ